MKKAVILTQPLYVNYGGILQNFALQKVLLKLNIASVTANRLGNVPSPIRRFLSRIKNETYNRIIGNYVTRYTQEERQYFSKNAKAFINKYINISPDIHSTRQLYDYINGKYDYVIVGSDQVWRPDISPDIYNYFLDFLSEENGIRKIAYSASFGKESWVFSNLQTSICKKLIKQFDAVSVREESGVSLCRDFLDIDAELVLDPTMLLSKDDYLEVVDTTNHKNRGGIFTYILDSNAEKRNLVDLISHTLSMNVFENQPIKDFYKETSDDIEEFVYPPIEGWIDAFHRSDFIITDSFHGTVFSILFNKPFLSVVNYDRGASRFYSLLNKFNLEGRLISDINQFESEILFESINYDEVNINLSELRDKSINFLKRNLC